MTKLGMLKKLPPVVRFNLRELRALKVDGRRSKPSRTPIPELVCSFNWVLDKTKGPESLSSINVPGDVPVYCPGRVKLPEVLDKGKRRIFQSLQDFNFETCQISSVPFESLFLATKIMNPTFRFDKVDLVIPLHLLRKLVIRVFQAQGLDPVGTTPWGKCIPNPREMHLQKLWPRFFTVQNTLFVHSVVFRKQEMALSRTKTCAYGLSFEQQFTTLRGEKGDKNSRELHYRAINCRLGGLNCVILYEADARWFNHHSPDDTSAISRARDTPTPQPALYSLDNRVPVFQQGSGAPQTDIIELKVRNRWMYSRCGPIFEGQEWEDVHARWFRASRASEILNVYLARTGRVVTGLLSRSSGRVESISTSHTAPVFEELDSQVWPHLGSLEALFRKLRSIAQEAGRPCRMFSEIPTTSKKWNLVTTRAEARDGPSIPRDIVETFWESAKSSHTPGHVETFAAGGSRQSEPPIKGASKAGVAEGARNLT
ncbi:hypothetical protein V8F20_003290 [Naviculisporaceae sp. PSN 640]